MPIGESLSSQVYGSDRAFAFGEKAPIPLAATIDKISPRRAIATLPDSVSIEAASDVALGVETGLRQLA